MFLPPSSYALHLLGFQAEVPNKATSSAIQVGRTSALEQHQAEEIWRRLKTILILHLANWMPLALDHPLQRERDDDL